MVDSNKQTSAEHPQTEQQQFEGSDDEPILPTSIADIEDILQYEGEEVTIDSQQTPATIVDEDADVYLEYSSADEDAEPDECSASQSELAETLNDNSLDDAMVIVEESTADTADVTPESPPPMVEDTMKVDSLTKATAAATIDDEDNDDVDDVDDEERLPSMEAIDQEKVMFMKLNANDEERRSTVIMNIKTTDDRVSIDMKKSPAMAKNAMPISEPMFGHTVNLLNNNKILIKSVKTSNSASASPILGKEDAPPATTSTARCDKIDENSMHSSGGGGGDSGECRTSCDSSGKATSKNAPYDEHAMADISVAVAAAPPSTSTPKINREFEMLTKTVNESKVLTEFIFDQSTRGGRRSLKSSTKRKQQLIPNTSMGSELSTTSVTDLPNDSPMADVRGQSKDSDKSGTSGSVQSGAGTNATGKRSTRSQNSDFSAKQRRFLKGIQQISRGTDDESENSAFDDDEDDIDYDCVIETKQPNESDGPSLSQPKIECEDTIDEKMSSIVLPSDKVSVLFASLRSQNDRK